MGGEYWGPIVNPGGGGGGGGSISEITSNDDSVTIVNPTGPDVDLSVSGGTVLSISYNGVGPFDVPALVPDGYDTSVGGQVFGVLLIGSGGITSGMLQLPTGGDLSDGSYPASMFIDNTGTIISFWLLDSSDSQLIPYNNLGGIGIIFGFNIAGNGSPLNVLSPELPGQIYLDVSSGGVFVATNAGDPTSWVGLGGDISLGVNNNFGINSTESNGVYVVAPGGLSVGITDTGAFTGTSNYWFWNSSGGDGNQFTQTLLGPVGALTQFSWQQQANGGTTGGIGCEAVGTASAAWGARALGWANFYWAVSSGAYANIGDSQYSFWMPFNQTTDATITQLGVLSTGEIGSPDTFDLTFPDFKHTMLIEARVVGRRIDVPGTVKVMECNNIVVDGDGSGAYRIIGVPTVTTIQADVAAAGWDCSFSLNGSNDGFQVFVTGQDSNTIQWSCTLKLYETLG